MDTPILKNKLYLYLTEFFAGMSVMAVELGASRLLAPYFSSSQIVWTIIIGTIMIAMALGNLYGGRSADKNPDPDRLYRRILIAAVWIAAIPLLGRYVIVAISGLLVVAVNSGFLIWAGFLSCIVLFVFPLFLLGTTTPSLARYCVRSLDDSGSTVGRLNAFNTIGSIIGTFVPTFVTIPAVGTAATFLIFSGVLLALGLLYFLSGRRGPVKCAISVVLYLVFSVFGSMFHSFAFWESGLLYEGESVYNYLLVRDEGRDVALSTNVLFGVQSVYQKGGGLTGRYYDYALAAPVLAGAGEDAEVLVLGMGTGTFASQCREFFPGIRVEGVEIDEKITELAREYFELDAAVPVTTYDGRAYLAAVDGSYDVIMVDAYQDITIPFQMSSSEFFTLVRSHLKPGGVMVVNMNMRSDKAGSINSYLADTIASVFPYVYTAEVPGTTNRELFAAETDVFAGFVEKIPALEREDLQGQMYSVNHRLTPYEAGGLLLTDDRAPVELLGMAVIDDLIQEELAYYKQIIREDGISGLISAAAG
ncbi:MAG: fused MFS/spermidine synthase [Oscillospiraceae bacterium]|nr:fused MFS/spermidine synthase [Oscillospiraceae bacterium]